MGESDMDVSFDPVASIEDQGFEVIKISNDSLAGNGGPRFNGGIIRWDGKYAMAYRMYSKRHGRSNIGMTLFDDNFDVIKSFELKLPRDHNKSIFEDPRLVVHKGFLYCSYTELDYAASPHWIARQRIVRLDDNFWVKHYIPLTFGLNTMNGTEKNWTFFSHNDRLMFCYNIRCGHVVEINDHNGKVLNEWKGHDVPWKYGHMRGGTTPSRYGENEYLTFFHGSDEQAWVERRYHMSPMTFSAKEPFYPNRIPPFPLVWGTRNEEFCGSGNGQCIFPMGHVDMGDHFLVSAGINDTFNMIIRIERDEVEKILRDYNG